MIQEKNKVLIKENDPLSVFVIFQVVLALKNFFFSIGNLFKGLFYWYCWKFLVFKEKDEKS